jgi:hypothetical protein
MLLFQISNNELGSLYHVIAPHHRANLSWCVLFQLEAFQLCLSVRLQLGTLHPVLLVVAWSVVLKVAILK